MDPVGTCKMCMLTEGRNVLTRIVAILVTLPQTSRIGIAIWVVLVTEVKSAVEETDKIATKKEVQT
jgi:hypothetical protein